LNVHQRRPMERHLEAIDIDSGLTIVLIAAVILAFIVATASRFYFQALVAEFGRQQAAAIAAWLADRTDLAAARRAARRGARPSLVLATVAGSVGEEAHETLQQRMVPSPEAAALLAAVAPAADGPFAERRALLIGVGAGVGKDVRSVLAHSGRRAVTVGFVVDPTLAENDIVGVDRAAGDLWDQLEFSREWASQRLSDGTADFAAILVRTPLTGDWDEDARLDLDRLLGILLDMPGDTWIAVSEPADPSAWPREVVISLPAPVRLFARALRNAGLPRPARTDKRDRYTLSMSAAQAMEFVIALTFDALRSDAPKIMPNTAIRLSAAMTLALSPAAEEGQARVERDDLAVLAAEEFLRTTNTRISSQQDGTERSLPLTVFSSPTIGWKIYASRPSELARGQQASVVTHDAPPAERWFEGAIESGDESIAAAILASYGRAWIERVAPEPSLNLLERASQAFDVGSRAWLWSRYLLALDSALRLSRPDAEWFTEELCEVADRTELGILFHAERVEFTRLRGDLSRACAGAIALQRRLSSSAPPAGSGSRYATATSRYLVANLLRQGGQYDPARQLVEVATAEYEVDVPSHQVELTHCMYARSVCDAMRGVATVLPDVGWPPDEAVFARSLVTLSNSHAAWFIADYERAIEFADAAHEGFHRIGYNRYASRASRLASLLDEWARRAGRRSANDQYRPDDPNVKALLAAQPGTRVAILAAERPSRALSMLQFALTYGTNPDAQRSVDLPQYINVTDRSIELVTPPPARSYRSAEILLRSILGIGSSTPVPLAVD